MRRWLVICGSLALVGVVATAWLIARHSRPKPYSILFITLDTTRADRIHSYGDAGALTPALDELAAQGTLFESAFSNVPLTLPSHITMMTGLLPPEHGVRTNGLQRLNATIPTLAEILKAKGYRTGAFVGACVLNARFGLGRGFQTYDDEMSHAYTDSDGEALSVCRSGEFVTDAAIKWLDSQPGAPFFCWVHLYDAHHPYHAHALLAGTRFAGQETYNAQIAFIDSQVGRLTRFLADHGLAGRTIVIVAGDHGEGLGDHGEMAHGYMLYDTTQRVPLIVSTPAVGKRGMRISSPVALVDLYTTVLDTLQMTAERPLSSRSLVPLIRGQARDEPACYVETDLPHTSFGWSPLRGMITSHWKYVRTRRPELYDRASDPAEQVNLAAQKPDVVQELDRRLADVERGMKRHGTGQAAVTSESRKQLESLGYVGHVASSTQPDADYSKLSDIKDMMPVTEMAARLGSLTQDGKNAEALEISRKMAQLSPDSARVRCYLGTALRKAGKIEEAKSEFEAALKIDAGLDSVHEGLGELLEAQGKIDEAIAAWNKTLELNANNDEAHTRLAVALAGQGKFEQAAAHFSEVAQLRPADAKPRYNLGRLCLDQGRPEEAIIHLTQALRLDPVNDQVRTLLGKVHHGLAVAMAQQGNLQEAQKRCEEALKLDPGSTEAHNTMGIILSLQGQMEPAVQSYRDSLKIDPNNAQAQKLLDAALAEMRNPSRQPAMGRRDHP